MSRRVVVTGIGAVTPLGVGRKFLWNRLIAGECSITKLPAERYHDIPSRVAGQVPSGNRDSGGWNADEWLSLRERSRMARFIQFAVAAAQEAFQDAGIQDLRSEARESIGVSIGSGIGSLEDIVDSTTAYATKGYKSISPLFVPRLLINMAAGHVSMRYGFGGPSLSPSTACTTGAHAIGDAFHILRHAKAGKLSTNSNTLPPTRVMLAGAAESCLHPVALAGFSRARSLSTSFNDQPYAASRPFDRQRDGFVISEGAAILVLEDLEHALERGAEHQIYAEIVGYGTSSDAHHITAPRADGRGAYLGMRRALEDVCVLPHNPESGAVLNARQVNYINAHATGTLLGDAAENAAIRQLMVTEGGMEPGKVNVSSTKGALGHLLGASGAVEAACSVLSVRHDIVPPTLNLDATDDAPDATGANKQDKLGKARSAWDLNYVPKLAQHTHVGFALSNSFGFGGTCASLCFRKYEN